MRTRIAISTQQERHHKDKEHPSHDKSQKSLLSIAVNLSFWRRLSLSWRRRLGLAACSHLVERYLSILSCEAGSSWEDEFNASHTHGSDWIFPPFSDYFNLIFDVASKCPAREHTTVVNRVVLRDLLFCLSACLLLAWIDGH